MDSFHHGSPNITRALCVVFAFTFVFDVGVSTTTFKINHDTIVDCFFSATKAKLLNYVVVAGRRQSRMRISRPSLRWFLILILLRVVLLVATGTARATYIDSCFLHCATPSSLAIVRRKQKQRPPRQWSQQEGRFVVGSTYCNRNDRLLYCQQNDNKWNDLGEIERSLDRRSFLWGSQLSVVLGVSSSVLLGCSSLQQPSHKFQIGTTAKANAADSSITKSDGRLTDQIVQSLVFEKILGSGSYKTVYLVSATIPAALDNGDFNRNGNDNDNDRHTGSMPMNTARYALAVERLRTKRDVKNAFRGVRIPELIQQGLLNDTTTSTTGASGGGGDRELFETIVDWWIQSSNVPEYAQGKRLFPSSAVVNMDKTLKRTRSEPSKNFAGSRWMLSFKPVYDTDLKRFIRNAPVLFPVGSNVGSSLDKTSLSYNYWTEPVLMTFVLEILHAGKLMHEAGIVHRDIKPKNMMIYTTTTNANQSPSSSGGSTSSSIKRRPVIIDYGFSEVGSPLLLEGSEKKENKKDICVVRPGQLKGEVDYVLAEDLAKYRGCQRGDAYAMGKTLYEFVFGSSELQLQQQNQDDDREVVISVNGAEVQNQAFRKLLFDNANAGTESRFRLSKGAADCLLSIVRGLCSNIQKDALSFAEAEAILSDFLSPSALP